MPETESQSECEPIEARQVHGYMLVDTENGLFEIDRESFREESCEVDDYAAEWKAGPWQSYEIMSATIILGEPIATQITRPESEDEEHEAVETQTEMF